jgi:uncharacterized membrane protein HdeD (DUF308 family)
MIPRKEKMLMQVDPFALVPQQVIQHWGISLAMGIGLTALAIVAWLRSFRSSIDSVYFFGCLFMIAAAIEAVDAYMTGGWSGFYLHLVGAILFGVTGIMLLIYAKASTEIATLIVAMYFIIAGIFNIIAPMAANVPDRGWHVWAGFITLILGPALLGYRNGKRDQLSAFRVIGIFIGIDLFFRGLAFSFLAADLRSH